MTTIIPACGYVFYDDCDYKRQRVGGWKCTGRGRETGNEEEKVEQGERGGRGKREGGGRGKGGGREREVLKKKVGRERRKEVEE